MFVGAPICPECGSALRSRTSRGLCPQCLLKTVLSAGEPSLPEAAKESRLQRFGSYELLRELGRGGMGVVYEARQVAANRCVALKMILPAHLASRTDVERFRLEAKAVALLDHPGILPIYDVGEVNGQAYFTMKLVAGGSLAHPAISQQAVSLRNPREAARLVAQIARAVHYAHERGIQHRDLKPGNILLDADGRSYLSDFGLAKFFEGDSSLTVTSAVLGSPAYMAPEQARGDVKNVTTAADIYSLGAVLYELLSGRPPFQGGTVYDTMRQVAEQEPPRPSASQPGLDRDLEIICLKCLAKDPQRRYGSAQALAEDLERWLAGEPIFARPAMALEKFWLWSRRNPKLAGVSIACLLAVAVGGVGITLQWRRAERFALEEAHQRQLALESARQARLDLYAADMSVAAQALSRGNLGLARLTLAAHRPVTGQEDLRGFEWRYLLDQSRGQQLATMAGHSWIVTCVAFSPNGALLASGSLDGSAKIWNASTHELVRSLEDGGISVSSLAFTPDGKQLVAATARGSVDFWRVATGEKERSFRGRLAALSPDGRILAVADSSPFYWEQAGSVKLWNCETGQLLGELSQAGRRPAFSRNGSLLAVVGEKRDVLVWDTSSLKLVYRLATPGPAWSVVFSPVRDLLVATGWSKDALVWDLSSSSIAAADGLRDGAGGSVPPVPVQLHGHELAVWSAAFSPDGATLATTSSDQTIRLWRTDTLSSEAVLRGHGSEVWCVAFSPNGKLLATGSKDKTVMLWSPRLDAPSIQINNMYYQPAHFSSDGRWFLTGTEAGDGWVSEVWDSSSLRKIASFPGVEMIGFAPAEGGLIAIDRKEGALGFWSINPPALTNLVPLEGKPGVKFLKYGLSPNGQRFFGIEPDGTAMLWDVRTGRRLGSAKGPNRRLRNAVLSFRGDRLAVSGELENQVHVLDLASGQDTLLTGHDDFVSGLAFSPDGTLLATGSMDGTLRLWSVPAGREVATLSGHMEEVADVDFSPDGHTLASVETGLMTKFWHVATCRELMSLPTPVAFGRLRFSPDGRTLTVNQKDNTLLVLRAPPAE